MNDSPDLMTDAELDAALRDLDAAQPVLTHAQRDRADALLASLVGPAATAPAVTATMTPIERAPSPRRVMRWLVPVAAASALVAGSLLLPGSPTVPNAYADWTPTPTPVAEPLLSRATESCRAGMAQWNDRSAGEVSVDPASARVVLAEQRGSHVFLALASDDGAEAQCLASAETGRVDGLTGSAPGAGVAPVAAPPTGLTGGGVGLQLEGTSGYAYTVGDVGEQVREVVVRSGDQTVTASVVDGHYAAWWPVTGVTPQSAAGVTAELDVTLADGTVLTDVQTDLMQAIGPKPGPTSVGRVAYGGGSGPTGLVRTVEGLVGDRVTKVTVHLDGVDHEARVSDGAFWAEWSIASFEPGPGAEATFTLTLDDGTVRAGVREND
ncbi:hypothetical protein [Propioniciclava sinopodophylli]|uniref:hypothetical protein n=1 Tax=Propioniciclava sinopodophylli TaxID=1837344 RepID=UPI002491E408|nr:hypothetical protein [Propioniciclava sinopodophylli]